MKTRSRRGNLLKLSHQLKCHHTDPITGAAYTVRYNREKGDCPVCMGHAPAPMILAAGLEALEGLCLTLQSGQDLSHWAGIEAKKNPSREIGFMIRMKDRLPRLARALGAVS